MIASRAVTFVRGVYRYSRRRAVVSRMRDVKKDIESGVALKDKVALITGASRGIGFAIASAFARAGAYCILVTLERDAGNAALDALENQGLAAELHVADVSNAAQVRFLAFEVTKRHPNVDILVNNAGVFLEEDRSARASAVEDAIVQRTLAVNLYGAIHMAVAFSPHMRTGGRIINVSSVMGQLSRRPDGYASAYRLSKAALNQYTRSLATDLKARGVMVDCFHPGWVKTVLGGPQAQIEPEDAVDTAFFLATRPASSMTGLFWWDCEVIEW